MVFYPGTQPFRCHFWPYFSANSKSGSPLLWVSMVAQFSELGMASLVPVFSDNTALYESLKASEVSNDLSLSNKAGILYF